MSVVRWSIGVLSLLLASVVHAENDPENYLAEVRIPITNLWEHAQVLGSNRRATAFYDHDYRLMAQWPDAELQEHGVKLGPTFLSGVGVGVSDNRAGLLWYDKDPDKAVFLLTDDAVEPINIDDVNSNPLGELALTFTPDERWQALWVGERKIEGEPLYNVYHRLEGQAGERVVPAEQLAWLPEDDGGIVVFGRRPTEEGEQRIVFRHRAADADEFAPEEVVTATPPFGMNFRAWNAAGIWAVAWDVQYAEVGIANVFKLALSADQGETWQVTRFPGEERVVWYSIDVAADTDGQVVVALTGMLRAQQGDRPSRFAVMRSTDGGRSWSDAWNPRDEQWAYSRINAAKVVPGVEPGELYLLWEDWRSLRPKLYGGFSTDFGVTWEVMDQRFADQPKGRNGLAAWRHVAYRDTTGPYVMMQRYHTDRFHEYGLIPFHLTPEFTATELADFAPDIPDAEDKLQDRVEQYWHAMGERDWVATYAFLDPYTRNTWPLEGYISRRGPMNYSDLDIEAIRIEGPIAYVDLSIDAEIPRRRLPGTVVNPPEPRRVSMQQRWLWLDGQWHHEYHEAADDGLRFAQYVNR